MRKRRPGRLIGLLCCLTLCACGVMEYAPPVTVPDSAAVPDTLPGRAANLLEYETLLTVDGRDIPAWQYLYWLSLACDRAATLSDAPDWNAVREQALMNTALYASVETLAARHGVAFDAADREAVAERWRQRCDAYGGEDAYLTEIARYGLNRERAETLFRVALLYGKLRELCKDGGELAPSQADLDALAKTSGDIRIDRILSADGDRAAAKRRAEAFFNQLNGASNQAALFSELTWEGVDHTGPRSLKDGVFDERLTQAARTLQVGQISGIIESDDGFSILRRLPPERDGLLETWLRRTVEQAAQSADVELTERYFTLNPSAFAAALKELRNHDFS